MTGASLMKSHAACIVVQGLSTLYIYSSTQHPGLCSLSSASSFLLPLRHLSFLCPAHSSSTPNTYPPVHARTHTHAHARTHARPRTHTQTLFHHITHTHALSHTHTNIIHTLTLTLHTTPHTRALSPPHTHSRTTMFNLVFLDSARDGKH